MTDPDAASEPPGPLRDETVLDEAVLATFERAMGPKHAAHFEKRFRLRVAEFKAVLASDAPAEAKAQVAHKLIALAGNLGCVGLVRASRAICDAVKHGAADVEPAAHAARLAADAALDALSRRTGGPTGP